MAMRAHGHPRWQGTTPDLHGRATTRGGGSTKGHGPAFALDLLPLRSPSQFHHLDAKGVVTPRAGSPC